MKKFMTLCAALALAVSMVACSASTDKETSKPTGDTKPSTQATTAPTTEATTAPTTEATTAPTTEATTAPTTEATTPSTEETK